MEWWVWVWHQVATKTVTIAQPYIKQLSVSQLQKTDENITKHLKPELKEEPCVNVSFSGMAQTNSGQKELFSLVKWPKLIVFCM